MAAVCRETMTFLHSQWRGGRGQEACCFPLHNWGETLQALEQLNGAGHARREELPQVGESTKGPLQPLTV